MVSSGTPSLLAFGPDQPNNQPIITEEENDMTRVAFVGLGAMGLPMARNLLANGFTVTGYDLNCRERSTLSKVPEANGRRRPPRRRPRRIS